MTKLTKEQLNFQKTGHASYELCYITEYYDSNFKVGKYTEVGRTANGFPTDRQKTKYFIEGYVKEFKTLEEMIETYNRIKA